MLVFVVEGDLGEKPSEKERREAEHQLFSNCGQVTQLCSKWRRPSSKCWIILWNFKKGVSNEFMPIFLCVCRNVNHVNKGSYTIRLPDHAPESAASVRRILRSLQWKCRLKDCKPNVQCYRLIKEENTFHAVCTKYVFFNTHHSKLV